MSERVYICDADELQPGERITLTVKKKKIGVLNIDGTYHALSNICPHQRGPVCEGAVKNKIEGEFVESGKPIKEFHSDTVTISCPYHGWEYDIETGDHVGDSRFSIPTYNVIEEDGEIYVNL